MITRTLSLAMALGALLCTATATAQSDVPQNTVRLDFSAYSLSSHLGELRYLSGEDEQKLTITNYRRTKLQHYQGSPLITFYRGELNADGHPTDIVTQVPLNTRLKQPLLLFAESSDGVRVLQIEDAPSTAPPGSLRFMNLSDMRQQLFIGIGERAEIRKKIEPLGIVDYQIQDGDIGNLRIQIARANDGAPEMLKDMRVFPNKLQRNLYFIFQPDLNKPRLKIKLLSEKPRPAQADSNPE
jgi:hypothetical protein